MAKTLTCFPSPDGGQVCRQGPDPACAPPLVPVFTDPTHQFFVCVEYQPPPCKPIISIPVNDPSSASLVVPQTGCDAAGLELGLAVILAKLLGGRL